MSDTFRDPFESAGGTPALSWPNTPDKTVEGIIVPVEVNDAQQPYRVSQRTNMDTGELEFWDEEQTQPKLQTEITLLTGFTGFTGTSDNFRENVDEDDEDDGLRRVFVYGDLEKKLKEALKAAKARKPEVGGTVKARLVKKEKVAGTKFSKNIFEVKYTPPTPETTAKAQAAFAATQPQQDGDPFSEPEAGEGDDAPF